MRNNYLAFLHARGMGLLVSVLALVTPLGFATWTILHPSLRGVMQVYFSMKGSSYDVNSVLLVLMVASQVALFAMLIIYLYEAQQAAFAYQGASRLVKACGLGVVILVFGGCLALWGYLVVVGLAIFHRPVLSAEELFLAGRLVLLCAFFFFLVLDLTLWLSAARVEEERRCQISTANGASASESRRGLKLATSDKDFAKASALLIDVPVLMVALGAFGLQRLLNPGNGYGYEYDSSYLSNLLHTGSINKETLALFGNGLEAGITIALMLFSQIEFLVLKTRWSYRTYQVLVECEDQGGAIAQPVASNPGGVP